MPTRVQVLRVIPPYNRMIFTIILSSFQDIYNTDLFQNMSYYAHFFDKHDKKVIDTQVALQGALFLVEQS